MTYWICTECGEEYSEITDLDNIEAELSRVDEKLVCTDDDCENSAFAHINEGD